ATAAGFRDTFRPCKFRAECPGKPPKNPRPVPAFGTRRFHKSGRHNRCQRKAATAAGGGGSSRRDRIELRLICSSSRFARVSARQRKWNSKFHQMLFAAPSLVIVELRQN